MIVVITGLIAGLIHVLTGPDHLTAIAPLAVRRPDRAWVPGVRWAAGATALAGAVGAVVVFGLAVLLARSLVREDEGKREPAKV